MRIYPASSWRNKHYPDVVAALRADGHDLYDFRTANGGLRWSCSNYQEYVHALEADPNVIAAFERDRAALLDWCDVCELILPCGKSAHLEAAFASAAGKPVIVQLDPAEPLAPELMYRLLGIGVGGVHYVVNIAELLAALHACERKSGVGARSDLEQLGEQLARDEMEKVHRLIEAGYSDLADKVLDNEIDIGAAMQIFGGRRS
jgi:hypothetical protein